MIDNITVNKITAQNFERAWARVLAVATHQKWEDSRIITFIPTILDDFMFDAYQTLEEQQKKSSHILKEALAKAAGVLQAETKCSAQKFLERNQREDENVSTYSIELKKLFLTAFPDDVISSQVLLQKFICGLRVSIKSFLTKIGIPETLEEAINNAVRIESTKERTELSLNALSSKQAIIHPKLHDDIQSLTKMVNDLGMEIKQLKSWKNQDTTRSKACFKCGKHGHWRRNCPLNLRRLRE